MPPWLVKLIGSGAVASLLVAVLQWAWARAEDNGFARAQVLWEQRVKDATERTMQIQAQLDGRQITALDKYIRGQAAIRPIEAASRETVTIYAQTDTGRRACLPAERVRGIEQLAETLGLAGEPGDTAAAGNGADELQPD